MRYFKTQLKITFISILALSSSAAKASELIELAEKELQIPAKPSTQNNEALLKTLWPEDTRDITRSSWSIEIGLENQKPQGELEISSLDPVILNKLENKLAVSAGLSWWFSEGISSLAGSDLRSSLSLELAWSQHQYQVQTPGTTDPVNARLHVLRPQLSLQSEYRIFQSSRWDTGLWMGLSAGRGRLIQSQNTTNTSLLNVTLSSDYNEWGPQLSLIISDTFIMGIKYRQRHYSNSQLERSHHALLSAGISL